MNRDYEEWMNDQLKSHVYNALSEIMGDFPSAKPEDLDRAIEWFQIHFYDECE